MHDVIIKHIFSLLCSLHQSTGCRSHGLVQERGLDMSVNEGITHVLLPVSNLLGLSFILKQKCLLMFSDVC